MQRINNIIFRVLVAVVALFAVPVAAEAQNFSNSINTYSPYSMYGMGELATPGDVIMRSMGGVGIAMYSYDKVNLLNPAAYGNMSRKSFIFNFGVDAGHYRNEQMKYGASSSIKTAYNSINFHEIAFQMPLAENLGFGFSLTPYSSVGYKMFRQDSSDPILGNVGRALYQWDGEGDVTEVKAGIGWRPFKRFSIGVAALYYWGDITRNYKSLVPDIITGSGSYSSTTGVDEFVVSRFKAQFGLQFHPIMNNKRILSIGATYDLGGGLAPELTQKVYVDNLLQTTVRDKSDKTALRLPSQIAAGVFYQTNAIRMGVDYVYQNWGDENGDYAEDFGKGVKVAYADTHTLKVGFEIVPRAVDVRNYFNRMSYRLGARAGDYYQTFEGTSIKQYAVTAGLGFPVRLFGNSSINVGFEYGMRRPDKKIVTIEGVKTGLIKQDYFKLSLGLSLFGEDRWFQRYKFD